MTWELPSRYKEITKHLHPLWGLHESLFEVPPEVPWKSPLHVKTPWNYPLKSPLSHDCSTLHCKRQTVTAGWLIDRSHRPMQCFVCCPSGPIWTHVFLFYLCFPVLMMSIDKSLDILAQHVNSNRQGGHQGGIHWSHVRWQRHRVVSLLNEFNYRVFIEHLLHL